LQEGGYICDPCLYNSMHAQGQLAEMNGGAPNHANPLPQQPGQYNFEPPVEEAWAPQQQQGYQQQQQYQQPQQQQQYNGYQYGTYNYSRFTDYDIGVQPQQYAPNGYQQQQQYQQQQLSQPYAQPGYAPQAQMKPGFAPGKPGAAQQMPPQGIPNGRPMQQQSRKP
jgi:hypothetical protein